MKPARARDARMELELYFESTLSLLQKWLRATLGKDYASLDDSEKVPFEDLYRHVYTLTLHKHGDRLYNVLKEIVAEQVIGKLRESIGSKDEGFLERLGLAWKEYQISMLHIGSVFTYLDNVHVERYQLEPSHVLCLITFRDEIVYHFGVSEILLKKVADERIGVTVNWSGVKSACELLATLPSKESQLASTLTAQRVERRRHRVIVFGDDVTSVYKTDFEGSFLKETAEHYMAVSQKFLAEHCASAYVKKVEKCIAEETDRVMNYFDDGTNSKLVEVLEEVLISPHIQTIVDMANRELKVMMSYDKVEDMRSLYLLLRRVPNGLDVMTSCVSKYLRDIGEKLMEDVEGERAEPVEAAADLDHNLHKLAVLRERFYHFLRSAFDNDPYLEKKILSDFEFISGKTRLTPDFLSRYIDDRLKKGGTCLSDSDLESVLNRSILLFRCLSDKEEFERIYKERLAKRLLLDKSISDDAEKRMASKLATEGGRQFTRKLEGMIKDKENWNALNANFKEFCRSLPSLQIDVEVRVLTAEVWPVPSAAPQCLLPDSFQAAFERFKSYYTGAHTGRKLTLNSLLGSADLKAAFYGTNTNTEDLAQQEEDLSLRESAPKRKENHKILQVDTLTMILLMRFNTRPKFTFEQLKTDTQIPERDLRRCLQSLSMGKASQRILSRKGKGKEIENGDEFTVNDEFTSKLTKIRIQNITNKSETESEKKEGRDTIEDDRKLEVEAAIVGIMKARKTIQHNDLVVEVTEQLQSRFQPDPQLIKKGIESLIEREYIKRSDDNHRVYQ